jgi:hypothetical protein
MSMLAKDGELELKHVFTGRFARSW